MARQVQEGVIETGRLQSEIVDRARNRAIGELVLEVRRCSSPMHSATPRNWRSSGRAVEPWARYAGRLISSR